MEHNPATDWPPEHSHPSYLRWLLPLMVSLLLASLAINAITIWTLLRVRAIARDEVGQLAQQLADASDEQLRLEVPIRQSVPISVSVPIRQSLTIPISATLPFDDVIEFPVLGTTIDVPVRTEIPVQVTVPVSISTTVALSTSVAINITLPVEVALRDTPLAGYLDRLRQQLLRMRDRL